MVWERFYLFAYTVIYEALYHTAYFVQNSRDSMSRGSWVRGQIQENRKKLINFKIKHFSNVLFNLKALAF